MQLVILNSRSISGYCIFVDGNLITWCSKKETMVARSNALAEYRAIVHTCELICIQSLLSDMGVVSSQSIVIYNVL